ncbi:MAG: hypothetical protein IID41_07245 [Planctomycetes bacterium]|nr:hypothetical protein [Planctomycetota bacterium]
MLPDSPDQTEWHRLEAEHKDVRPIRAVLSRITSAYSAAAAGSKAAASQAGIMANAVLASDFGSSMDSWLGKMFNEGIPSVYDKAVDAVYSQTHIGGGHLHRLFDGSHTPWSMWEKVQGAQPNDSLAEEVAGYVSAFWKDLSSPVGIPVVNLSPESYHQMADHLNAIFGIPRTWFADMLHVNATELIGSCIGVIAVSMNWKSGDQKRFARLVGSLGISAIATANPALAVVSLAAAAKSFNDARGTDTYADCVEGLVKGGVGTGVFLATASAVGGPAFVGVLAGMCVGAVVHRCMDTVKISEIRQYLDGALQRAG